MAFCMGEAQAPQRRGERQENFCSANDANWRKQPHKGAKIRKRTRGSVRKVSSPSPRPSPLGRARLIWPLAKVFVIVQPLKLWHCDEGKGVFLVRFTAIECDVPT